MTFFRSPAVKHERVFRDFIRGAHWLTPGIVRSLEGRIFLRVWRPDAILILL